MRHLLGLLAALVALPATCPLASAQPPRFAQAERVADGSVTQFQDVSELLNLWAPDSHLYVRGRVRLSSRELDSLEGWLDEHGPHWTVLLLEDARGLEFVDRDGRRERGMDAIELAIGETLMDRSNFRDQTHPRTQEPDGAVFVLFLKERKFSYRGSTAQDRRDLGASRWMGRLDRPAFRAMRGGGRIADAVKDTVTSINKALDQRISHEIQSAIRRQQQRRTALETLGSRLDAEADRLDAVARRAQAARETLGSSSGDLGAFDRDRFESQLELMKAQAQSDQANPAELNQRLGNLDRELDRWNAVFAEFERFDTSKASLEDRRRALQQGALAGAAKTPLQQANEALEQAQARRDRGDREFQNSLNAAERALREAETQMQRAADREQQAAARARLIRNTTIGTSAVGGVLLLGLLAWLNRRRAPARRAAIERLDQRKAEVAKELDGVMTLIDRGQTVIGTRDELARKKYAGRTLDLCHSALEETDDLLVMSNSVERVLERAEAWIRPRGVWGRVVNFVSGSRFENGADLLDREPIRFDAKEGVSIVMDSEARDAGAVGPGEAPEVTLSFHELFDRFRSKSQRATASIDAVETAWSTIVATAQRVQAKLDAAEIAEKNASAASEPDGWFAAPAIFEQLLPSAEELQDEGEILGRSDPISALDNQLAESERQASVAIRLAESAVEFRSGLLPSLQASAESLRKRGRDPDWIFQRLHQLTNTGNEIAQRAVEAPVTGEIDAWRDLASRLEHEARRALQLDADAANAVAPAIQASRSTVAEARSEIHRRLDLQPHQALNEPQQAPEPILDHADDDLRAAYSNLDRGDTDGAALAIQDARRRVDQAMDLVSRSLASLRDLPSRLAGSRDRLAREQSKNAEHEDILARLRSNYVESALLLARSEPEIIDLGAEDLAQALQSPPVTESNASESNTTQTPATEATESAAELPRLAAQAQQVAEQRLAESQDAFDSGGLLRGWELQLAAEAALQQSESRFERLRRHRDDLQQACDHNTIAAKQHGDAARRLAMEVEDRRSMQATQRLAGDAVRFCDRVARDLESGRRDPWAERTKLTQLEQAIEVVGQRWSADQAAFSEAERSLAAAAAQLAQAETLSDQTRRDNIPDSAETTRDVRTVHQLSQESLRLREQLSMPHQDWYALDRRADALLAEASATANRLSGQLQLARQAAAALQSAGDEVRRAEQWSGPFGVMVRGGAGRDLMSHARHALSIGDYAACMRTSQSAAQAARMAVQQAQAELARRRRAERRRQERERRRQRQASASSLHFGSSSGSSLGGFSGGSSSSSSSSSGGGSGGFGRSGW